MSFGTLGRRTHRVVYGEPTGFAAELDLISEVDLAHVVMLASTGLIRAEVAGRLLAEIMSLRDNGFDRLAGMPMPRGVYLAYESCLAEGGSLHTARSRNDLKATTTAMRLRAEVIELCSELLRMQAVLLNRARAYRDVVMPVYTHFQAAMPITYGHYLLGVALALGRDVAAMRAAATDLRRCPLGAVAVAGTDLPIDPSLTARLLGFDLPVTHAVDAVASRDTALRVLAAAAGAGVTLSRLGTDLQLWSTAEFGFIHFPDRLVGGSSAMPQKRNAFLLEHVKAKPAAAIGAWVTMASAIKSAPFTNSIEVGTDAVAALWPGLAAVRDTLLLAQAVAGGARPVPARMRERAEAGGVTATAAANLLVRQGIEFRAAHGSVQAGTPQTGDLDDAVAAQRFGGGPGAFGETFGEAHDRLREDAAWLRDWRDTVTSAGQELVRSCLKWTNDLS